MLVFVCHHKTCYDMLIMVRSSDLCSSDLTVRDPLRGNERIGRDFSGGLGLLTAIDGATGGNPNVDPQKSKSWSFGTLLTPRFVPGLTLRVDWTRITIRNAYFDPRALLVANTVEQQQAFEDFLAAHPERFTREAPPPGDPFRVGKIVFIDATQKIGRAHV